MKNLLEQFNRVNEVIATKTTVIFGTMWCAYAFLLWALLPLTNDALRDLVFYVSGAVIQLVALPLIMVGQNILNRKSEQRAEEDHQNILKEFAEIRRIHEETQAMLATLTSIDAKLTKPAPRKRAPRKR